MAENPAALSLDEGQRFPLCRPDAMASLFAAAALTHVSTHPLDIPTHFASFDDYWSPFLQGTGPAPAYVSSLDDGRRNALRARLERRLAPGPGGGIQLTARAWAVRGGSA